MAKKILIILLVLGIGLGLGGWTADYIRSSDLAEAVTKTRVVPSNVTKAYAVRRISSEGICNGRRYVFYNKAFEVLELKLGIGTTFSITSSFPLLLTLQGVVW